MTFDGSRGVVVDDEGNVQTDVWMRVRKQVPGLPNAPQIYADPDGVTPLDNPFFCPDGEFEYYAVGGYYNETATKTGFSKTRANIPIGTAKAADVDHYAQVGFVWAPESATATPPSTGCIRWNNADVSLATHVYINKTTLGNSSALTWLQALSINDWLLTSTGAGIEAGWQVTGITEQTAYFDITISNYSGPAGPISFGDSGFVTVSQERKGAIGISPGFTQLFDGTSTADSDPGNGKFRLNNATHASATVAYLDALNNVGGDTLSEIDTWDDSTSVIRGFLRITSQNDPSIFRLYSVGVVTTVSGYRKVAITYIGGNGVLADTTPCSMAFVRNGDKGDTGLTGAASGFKYQFNTSTSNADPGTGKLAINNAALASATALYINEIDADAQAIAAVLATWTSSTNPGKGRLRIEKESAPANFVVYAVTGTITDNGTWDTFTIAALSSAGTIANNDQIRVSFSQAGDKGDIGATGSVGGYKWTFNSSVSNADPGSGKFAFDNATFASITKLYINETNADSQALAALLATWDDSTNTSKGTLHVEKDSDPTVFADFTVTGALTDNGSWDTFSLTPVSNGGSLANNDVCRLRFSRTGDKGLDGTGVGDVVGPAVSVADQIAVFDGTTGKLLKDGGVTIAGLASVLLNKESIWIPADAMRPRPTNGAARGLLEMSTNKNVVATLDFDPTTQEFAQFSIRMPKSWDEGTVTFIPVWSHAATTVNFGVVWGLDAVAISDDDAMDVAFGTAQTSIDTGGTTNDSYQGPESSAITIAGSPAVGDYVMFRIHRDPSNGSDNMAIDARLHGLIVLYIVNSFQDN